MSEAITAILLLIGSVFMLLSAVGVVRMPDLFTRMHAATKVGTVGVSSIVLAAAFYFQDMKVVAPALLIIVFFLATAPVAAHMIGRAAYEFGVALWKGTVIDEWKKQGK
ncbi:MAG TPA: monovalent cation/H(+) antiporter subunit G [Kiritimatiellia bacterium]|nr:monovalent cation/H(+) antiporter subunit G [Kiritimatiellia bacterium]HMO99257.1 monovalent cation/H(+) antiporter subunit G [Kiritimatiellia bacterium]HMP96951.1 monovalent cation/H(+) antiporter subunit G [Kiritimatiellia bacterium]